jgi:hypothetical protein
MQWVTAVEDGVVIGLKSFPTELSVQVAGNTASAQMQARAWRIERICAFCYPLTITTYCFYYKPQATYCFPIGNSAVYTVRINDTIFTFETKPTK